MSKRLAITISGAVSLGDYEAGVLFEIIQALSQHNEDRAAVPDEQIFIDVMVGASAGAMTAAIAGQKLLYEGGALASVRNNALYTPWVRDVSLTALLNMQSGDDPTHSLLSSQLIEQISARYLTQRYQSGIVPARNPHPACATKLFLGLSLSNLNGIDYSVPLQTGGIFDYTRYQDEFIRYFSIDDASQDCEPVWEAVRNAAVSSGAFPFAFAVKELIRHPEEYTDPGYSLKKPIAYPPTNGAYAYTDGGVFQNEPLGLAKNLVDKIDDHRNTESRFYLFVAPGEKRSSIDTATPFRASEANFVKTLKYLGLAIFQQARFHDWITAENLNARINLLNERAGGLASAFLDGAVRSADLVPASDALLKRLFPTTAHFDDETVDSARDRLRHQYAAEFGNINAALGLASANAFIDAILTLEKSAGLGNYDEMMIYGITATDDELAGDPLFGFLGFFDQRLRDHDYDVGRQKARDFIDDLNTKAAAPGYMGLGPIQHAPWPDVIQIDPALGQTTVADLPESLRNQLKTQLKNRAFELTTEIGMPWVVREGVEDFYTLPQLNKLLGL
jgi:hypothetical protein